MTEQEMVELLYLANLRTIEAHEILRDPHCMGDTLKEGAYHDHLECAAQYRQTVFDERRKK